VTAPVFLADRDRLVEGARVMLDGPQGRHAVTVRRLAPGEAVVLSDGAGRIAHCKVTAAAKNRLELDVLDVYDEPLPQQRLVVIQALPKSDRGELAVGTMTEVGVDVIVPWAAARCIAQWRGERTEKALGRWRATAREAAKQARRSWLPDVTELASTAQVAARIRAAATAVMLHEEATAAIGDIRLPATGDILLIVGPGRPFCARPPLGQWPLPRCCPVRRAGPSGRDGRDHWPVPTLQSLADSDRLGVQALYGAVVGRTVEETQDI
jgi:16S rRNA (uracil1498-N3)-methyltransferase